MNLAANLHPALEHVGAAGFSDSVPSSHKFTVSHATIFTRCIIWSGVLITPNSSIVRGLHSNKQYAKFFIPTSMLNTLNAGPMHPISSSFIVIGELGMAYIPSHDAIAGDGMNLFCSFCVIACIHACDHVFM